MAEAEARNRVLATLLAELGDAREVLDVGCGRGALLRSLSRRGFVVTGLDPQPEAIGAARAAAPDARLAEGSAAAMPFRAGSFDAVVFLNSLHHVPPPEMDPALAEAGRCLRPGGRLIVIEPMAEGPLFDVLRPVDDETEVRRLAQEALDRCRLAPGTDMLFRREEVYAGFDDFVAKLTAADPARAPAIAREHATIAAAFEANALPVETGRSLAQPMRLRSFVLEQ
ncbi:class I SAM-dependent methyltransferase [Acidimangrovimonas sediminis]|uniref:class I SAM-dependent methyltransferase n=1 Tax=Acidimangrovimonas sediminis TaxID=2056283 RepID=UPI000C8070DD|nr:class I SAM-dependent methyltransferase [Acidimangrovimonas sediminis]